MPSDNRQRLTIWYDCPLCGATRIQTTVRCRNPATMDVVQWMEEVVGYAINRSHTAYSPGCRPERIHNLVIPIGKDPDAFVGMYVDVQNDPPDFSQAPIAPMDPLIERDKLRENTQ